MTYTILAGKSIYVDRRAIQVSQWINKRGRRFKIRGKICPLRVGHVHEQWLWTHCQWYPIGDVITFLVFLSVILSNYKLYYCHAVLFFRAAVSVFMRPCCPARLTCIDVHVCIVVWANKMIEWRLIDNWRMDRHSIFKLRGEVDHMAGHVWPLTKIKRSRLQGHIAYQQQERYNWAMCGRINFKLGENYHSRWQNIWRTL